MHDPSYTYGATFADGASARASGGAIYRLVWKWHFFAALYVLPFKALLALTCGIYPCKPQIKARLYADQWHATPAADLALEDHVAAVERAAGMICLGGFTDYDNPMRSTRIGSMTPTKSAATLSKILTQARF